MSVARFAHTTFNPAIQVGLDTFDLVASRMGFVGLDIAPPLEVTRQTGEYKKRDVRDILMEFDTERHDQGTYSQGSFRFTKDSYTTKEHGFEVPVDERQQAIHASYWDAELEAAELARDQVLRNHNRRVVTAALAGTSLTAAAGTVWTNVASADPMADALRSRIAPISA